MGKKKIDKLKFIENKLQRNVAFCKRKRGFLKKAIELSSLCDQQILIVIYDKERNRLVQFSSDGTFQFKAAYAAFKNIKTSENDQQDNYERFTNDDYENLEKLDFRSVRYKKKHIYGENDEVISELDDTPVPCIKKTESEAKEDLVSDNILFGKDDPQKTDTQQKYIKTKLDRKKNTSFGIDISEENEVRKRKTLKDLNEAKTVQKEQQDSLKDEKSVTSMKRRDEKLMAKNQNKPILILPSQGQIQSQEIMFGPSDKISSFQLQPQFKHLNPLKLNGSGPQIKFNNDLSAQKFHTNSQASKIAQTQSISYDISQNGFKVIIPKQRLVQPTEQMCQNAFLNSIIQKNVTNRNLKQIVEKFENRKSFQNDKEILSKLNLDHEYSEANRRSRQVSSFAANVTDFNSDVNQSNAINNQENQKNQATSQQLEKEFLNILTQLNTNGEELKVPEKLLQKITTFDTLQAFLENIIRKKFQEKESQSNEEQIDMTLNQMQESLNKNQQFQIQSDPNCQQQIDSNNIQSKDSNTQEKPDQTENSQSVSQIQSELNKQLKISLVPNQQPEQSPQNIKSIRSQSAQNQNLMQYLFTQKQLYQDSNQFAQLSNEQFKGDQMKFMEWIFDQIKQDTNLQQDQSPQDYAEKQPIFKDNSNNTSQRNKSLILNQDRQNLLHNHQANHIFNNFQNISGTPAMDPQGETPMFQAGDIKMDQADKMAVDLTGWGNLKRTNQNQGFQPQKSISNSHSPQQQQTTQDISNLRNILFQQQKITQTISGLQQQLLPQQVQPQRAQRMNYQMPSSFKPINQMNGSGQNSTVKRFSRSYSNNNLQKDTQPKCLKFNSNVSKAQSSQGSLGLNKMLRIGSQSPNASSISNIKNNFWIANQILNTKAQREKSMLDSISQVSEENSFAFMNRNPIIPKLVQKNNLIERSGTMQNVFTSKNPTKSNIGDQKCHDNISMGLFADQIRDTSHHKN